MILITSLGEFPFILLLSVFFYFNSLRRKKKKELLQDFFFLFGVFLGCPVLDAGEHVPVD